MQTLLQYWKLTFRHAISNPCRSGGPFLNNVFDSRTFFSITSGQLDLVKCLFENLRNKYVFGYVLFDWQNRLSDRYIHSIESNVIFVYIFWARFMIQNMYRQLLQKYCMGIWVISVWVPHCSQISKSMLLYFLQPSQNIAADNDYPHAKRITSHNVHLSQ